MRHSANRLSTICFTKACDVDILCGYFPLCIAGRMNDHIFYRICEEHSPLHSFLNRISSNQVSGAIETLCERWTGKRILLAEGLRKETVCEKELYFSDAQAHSKLRWGSLFPLFANPPKYSIRTRFAGCQNGDVSARGKNVGDS